MKIVIIEWIDSASQANAGMPLDELSLSPIEAMSAGLLVHEDAGSVTLAQDIFPKQEGHSKNTWRNVLTIPRSCITRIEHYAPPGEKP